jgi:hypothetical protein
VLELLTVRDLPLLLPIAQLWLSTYVGSLNRARKVAFKEAAGPSGGNRGEFDGCALNAHADRGEVLAGPVGDVSQVEVFLTTHRSRFHQVVL